MQNQSNNTNLPYGALRFFFTENDIDIDVDDENMHRKFYYAQLIDPSNPSTGIEFVSYENAYEMEDDLRDENRALFIFDRNMQGRRIHLNSADDSVDISEPLEEIIAKPEKPNWFVYLFKWLVDSFKVKVDNYNVEKQFYDAYVFKKAEFNVGKDLDNAFDAYEEAGKGDVNRIDYIMIGGRSLRAHLMDDIISNRADKTNTARHLTDDEKLQLKNISKERIEQIVFGAMVKGIQVEYLKMDPKTMDFVSNPQSQKNILHVLEQPPELKKLSAANREQFAGEYIRNNGLLNHEYNKFTTKDARWEAIEVCRKGIIHQARTDKAKKVSPVSHMQHDNLFGEWQRRNEANGITKEIPTTGISVNGVSFSFDRSCFQSHVIAYLLAEKNMSLEDILNPDAGKNEEEKAEIRQQKADATDYMYDQFLSPEGSLDEIMRINVAGSRKLLDYVKENNQEIDPLDNASMFSDKALLVSAASFIQFDLNQERTRNKQLAKPTAKKMFAIVNGLEPGSKEALAKYDQLDTDAFNYSCIEKCYDGQKDIIPFATGCGGDSSDKSDFLVNELCRQEAGQNRAADKNAPLEKILPQTSVAMNEMMGSMLISNWQLSEFGKALHTDDIKFAKFMLDDTFRKNMKVTRDMSTGEITCKKVSRSAAKPKAEEKVDVKDNATQAENNPMIPQ